MIGLSSETQVWLASGATDMRRGFDGLALLVQETLKRDPHCGHLFVFRGKRGEHTSLYIPIAVRCRSLSLASAARQTSACSATVRQARSAGSPPRSPFIRLVGD